MKKKISHLEKLKILSYFFIILLSPIGLILFLLDKIKINNISKL